MTEYDFSPEAYERHLEKQHNIARWVDKTRRYVPANPFFPATPANRHATLHTRTPEDSRSDNTQPHRHHRSHSSHSSKHHSRRHRSTEPSSSHRRSSTAPPAQWQPVVDRHTDPYYTRAPQHAAPFYHQQYPVAPQPLRANTTPVYLYPAPGKNNPYTTYPNPIAPHASTRRFGSGKSGHSVSGFGRGVVGRD